MATTINANNTDGVVITPDTSGELELQANGVTKAKVTANGLQDANGASLRGGSFRNLIINGDMQIAQRGTSVSGITGDGLNTVDRFALQLNSSGTWTQTQDTDVPLGQGFSNSIKMQCTTATASPNYLLIQQRIEAQNLQHLVYGTASAKTVTASFWVKSNKTGTYINELYIQDDNRTISTAFTISSANTWEKKVITFAGDTVGVIDNDNGLGMYMSIWLATGSTFSSGTLQTSWGSLVQANRAVGQVNLADSTSNYINITGVQLEVGEGASDFEFLPYDVQLARCQRYYYRLTALTAYANAGTGRAYSTANGQAFVEMPVPMRASPSSTGYSSLSHWNHSGLGSITALSPASQVTGDYRRMSIDITGTFTNGQAVALNANNTTSAWIEWSAEL